MRKPRQTLNLLVALIGIFGVVPTNYAAVVASVQSGTTSSTGNGTVTVGVTSVDMSKSFLIFQTRHSGNRPASSTVRGELTSGTTLAFTRSTNESSTIEIQWYLVEYTSGVSVQRGSTTQNSTAVTVTLGSSVGSTSDAFLLYSKTPKSTDSSYGTDDPITGLITATDKIQFKANSTNSNHIIAWQVIEFTDGSLNVQTGTDSITDSGATTATDSFGSTVDLTSTFLLAGWRSGDEGADIDERLITAKFSSTSSVQFTRGDSGGDDVDEITYQVIEFTDGTKVQSGTASFSSGETSKTVAISTVDTLMTVPLATIQVGDGQNKGNTEYSGDDISGEGSFTLSIISATSLNIARNSSNSVSTMNWQLIDLSGASGGGSGGGGGGSMTCTALNSSYGIVAGGGITVEKDTEINGNEIAKGTTATNASIEPDADIIFGAVAIPPVEPEPFPTNSSSTNITHSDSPINTSSEVFYNNATVGEDKTLSFTGGGTFHIDRLTAAKESKLRFSAGTYYIDTLEWTGKEPELIVDSGPVILHIGTSMSTTDKELEINEDGDVSDLQILLHSGATIDFDEKDIEIVAIIIGPDSGPLAFGQDLDFQGIIQTSNTVTLGKDTELTLTSSDQNEIDNVSICTAGGSNLDHFEISHDGSGINCLDEIIEILAADNLGDAVEDYEESITLDTQSGKGTWSLNSGNGTFSDGTANDGVATYLFHDDDDGVASFSLSYREGNNLLDIDLYQTSDSNIRDNDSESALQFNPDGFTLTQSLLSNPPPATINDPITTQTAGSDFSIHITAYGQTPTDPVCGVIEDYTGDKNLAFWFDYDNPGSGTIAPTVNTTGISTTEAGSVTQNVTFSNGRASVVTRYADVGEIQIHLKDGIINAGTSPFVVKPSTIVITGIKTNSGTNNPAATTATGTGFVAAGESFTVTLEVRGADGARTPNFGNESTPEGIELTASSLLIPAAGRNGSANNGAIANANLFNATTPAGTFTGNQFSWDEYGIIKLRASIADDNYLGTGEVTGSESSEVGRFYPAAFALTASNITAACNGFNYMSQPGIALSYNLEARGTGGNKLFNYDATLLGGVGVANPTLDVENNNQGSNLNTRLITGTSNWLNGGYSYSTLAASFNRTGSPDGPYTALAFGVSANDSLDSRTIGGLDMNATTVTNCVADGNCDSRMLTGTTQALYGRLEVSNTFGPETEALDIKMNASYFDGAGFVLNTLDNCTAYINTDASLSNYQGGLPVLTVTSPAAINLFQSGASIPTLPLLISAPAANNTGSVDLTYDAPSWLEYDWNGTGAEDPVGTASFGHFRGHDKVIYWREVWN